MNPPTTPEVNWTFPEIPENLTVINIDANSPDTSIDVDDDDLINWMSK